MTVSLQTPEDVVNAALVRIGYRMRVTNMFDGSLAANKALEIYGQTRDELLRQNDWQFAERNVTLTLLNQAPAQGYIPPTVWDPTLYPPLPWLFQYLYPDDCLKVRAVKGTPIFVPNFDPQPNVYGLADNTAASPAVKVILCNVQSAILVYTGRVTQPYIWEADFAEALVAALGQRLAPALSTMEVAKFEAGDAIASKVMAEMEEG